MKLGRRARGGRGESGERGGELRKEEDEVKAGSDTRGGLLLGCECQSGKGRALSGRRESPPAQRAALGASTTSR